MTLDAFKDWATVCEVGSYTPKLSISALLPDQKRTLWEHLKKSHPDKAREISLVMCDPLIIELMCDFGGELLLEEKYVPDSLRWLIKR